MKIRKLLAVALTATLLCGSVNVNAYAAEANTAETVTDVESTEESTNEDTEAGESTSSENTSSIEEGSIEESSEETTEAKEETEGTTEEAEEVTEENTEDKEEKTEEEKEEEKEEDSKKDNKKEKEEEKKTDKKTDKKKNKKKDTNKTTEKASYTASELRLMSALIFCEAGSEPYAGKLAVGIVVMNRVESKLFPNTLEGVVYQKYQFGPARNGSLAKALASYDSNKFTAANHKDSIKAAKEALNGVKTVTYNGKKIDMKDMLYFSGKVSGAKLTIANHQFK